MNLKPPTLFGTKSVKPLADKHAGPALMDNEAHRGLSELRLPELHEVLPETRLVSDPHHVERAYALGAPVLDVPAGYIKKRQKEQKRAAKLLAKTSTDKSSGSGKSRTATKTQSGASASPAASGTYLVREVVPSRGAHGYIAQVFFLLIAVAIIGYILNRNF